MTKQFEADLKQIEALQGSLVECACKRQWEMVDITRLIEEKNKLVRQLYSAEAPADHN